MHMILTVNENGFTIEGKRKEEYDAEIREKAFEDFAKMLETRVTRTENNAFSAGYNLSILEGQIDNVVRELKRSLQKSIIDEIAKEK